jgi:hypothetical protein
VIPLLPAWGLALVVILSVVVVPVAAMGLAMVSASRAAAPVATTESFWAGLLVEQRRRGVVFGTPETAPSQGEPAPQPHGSAGESTQARSPLVVRPYAYRADMTLRELVDANQARIFQRLHDRTQFSVLMASLRPRAVGRHRAQVA